MTGVSPARHGVLGNLVFDRASGEPLEHFGDRTGAPVRAETLWDRLAARGEPAAALCWPKTRGVAALDVYRAAHGHRPTLDALGAAFVMAGPGITPGAELDDVSMLDLAPTAAALLGLDLPGAEGAPLREALDEP